MNKAFKIYGILFLLTLLLLAFLEVNKNKVIDWTVHYSLSKKTPFGLYVFGKESSAFFKNNIKNIEQPPYNFYEKNKKKEKHNILIIGKEIDATSFSKILDQVKTGSNLFYSFDDDYPLSDFFKKFNIQNKIDYSFEGKHHLTDKKLQSASLFVSKSSRVIKFTKIPKNTEILGFFDNKESEAPPSVNFIKIPHGKGFIYLHTEPLIFTNYYILQGKNDNFISAVLSYLPKNRETLWFLEEKREVKTELGVMLQYDSFRYAWWVFLSGLLLFVIFNIKRRQRIIPTIRPLENKSVEFIKSVSNLYLNEGDLRNIMNKKAQYFLYMVRTEFRLDTSKLNDKFIEQLSQKTSKPIDKIKTAIHYIQIIQIKNYHFKKEDLIKMNLLLDDILNIKP